MNRLKTGTNTTVSMSCGFNVTADEPHEVSEAFRHTGGGGVGFQRSASHLSAARWTGGGFGPTSQVLGSFSFLR